jgi:signal transduction histidine kinase
VADGSIRNGSDERGAKLVTGSKSWDNYSVEADLMLLGQDGDAGLIIRSSDEEDGVNAYTGYYAGLRSHDNSLVFGRAEHEWEERYRKLPPGPGEIHPFQWYHLKIIAFQCSLVAIATRSGAPIPVASLAIYEKSCIKAGRIGLRSYASGGVWKNVVARPITQNDLVQIQAEANATQSTVTIEPQRFETEVAQPPSDAERYTRPSEHKAIGNLRLSSWSARTAATIRGAVILTSPALFVQDSSGGLELKPIEPIQLKVGDEVEATGDVHAEDFHTTLEHATVRELWAHTPPPAVAVSASQAATGTYDSNFIEVEGLLEGKAEGPNHQIILNLGSDSEEFRAIIDRDHSKKSYTDLQIGSVLRLRGVCVVDPAYTKNLTPFVLLLRSSDDLVLVAGPPWWSATHVLLLLAAALILAFLISFLYSRAEQWKLRAISTERERLAQEMHDTLAQSFAGIGFQIEAIRNEMPENFQRLHQQLDLATDLVRHSHDEAHRSIAALRPEALESGDLLSALADCAQRLVQGGSTRIYRSSSGIVRPIPIRLLDTMYRVGQEALANGVAHAGATCIWLSLAFEQDTLRLNIRDDGGGFSQEEVQRGFGLSGMRKRARGIGGKLTITSGPSGTTVEFSAPLAGRMTLSTGIRQLWNYLTEHYFHGANAK